MSHIVGGCFHILIHCKLDYAPLTEVVCTSNSFLLHGKLKSVHSVCMCVIRSRFDRIEEYILIFSSIIA